MGTDLALDVCKALPLGLPKYVVSTVSFSPIIPSERLSADIQMILWAGGLYGLNSICRSSLSQAAGAVLGAAKAVETPKNDKPIVGILHVVVYVGFLVINIELLEIVVDGLIGTHRVFAPFLGSFYDFLISFFEYFAAISSAWLGVSMP